MRFPESNLSPIESYISSKVHLRFELGLGFENGTIERVNQAAFRATTIFEEYFELNDDVVILIKSFEYPEGGCIELYTATKGYLELQIEDYSSQNVLIEKITVEEFDEAINTLGIVEMTDLTTTHIQKIICLKLNKINYKNIIKGIINLEMGLEPSILERVYFINPRNNVAFYVYDDRGCMLYANSVKTLKPTYHSYSNWLVDYHRETFDAIFSDNA